MSQIINTVVAIAERAEKQSPRKMAVIYAITSSFLVTSMFFCVSLLKKSYSSTHLVNTRMIIGFLMNSYVVHAQKVVVYREEKPILKLLILRGILGGFSMIFTFTCLTYMNLSDGIIMISTHPIWTSILSVPFLGESFSKKTLLCCIISFSGIVFVSRPTFIFPSNIEQNPNESTSNNQFIGSIFGIISSILISFVSIVLRKLSHQLKCPAALHMQYNYIISIIITTIILIVNNKGNSVVITVKFVYLNVILALCGVIGQLVLSKAMSLEKASVIAPLQYTQVIFSFLADLFILDSSILISSVIGLCLIILGSVGILI